MQLLEGMSEARRGAGLLCQLADFAPPAVHSFTSFITHDQLHMGWPMMVHGGHSLVYSGTFAVFGLPLLVFLLCSLEGKAP